MKILNLLLSVAGENESLKNLRLTVLGTASGGDFVSALALKLDVFAAVLVVSHGSEEAFKAASKGSYPPTLFVHLKLPWNSSILAIGKHLASLFHFILLPLIGEIAIDHFQFERKI